MNSDPLLLAKVKGSLELVLDEMDQVFEQIAFSPSIAEQGERGSGLFHPLTGTILVQGNRSYPLSGGTIQSVIEYLLQQNRSLQPEEIFLCNDPYIGGSHLLEVKMILPYFYQGKLWAFLGNAGTYTDLGGRIPAGLSVQARDICQSGVRFPLIKLYTGQYQEDILLMLTANSRFPRQVLGDIKAQVSSLRLGAQRLTQVLDTYGAESVEECLNALLEQSERELRSAIQALPDGNYQASDTLDNDGIEDQPLRLALTIQVQGDRLSFDFSESAPPAAGPMNSSWSNTRAACYVALKHLFPEVPLNSGMLQPLHFVPPGKVFLNATFPQAIGPGAVEVAQRIIDLVFVALAEILPTRVSAASFSTATMLIMEGEDTEKGTYLFHSTLGGGYGGTSNTDGLSNGSPLLSVAKTPSIERLEKRYPLLFQHYSLRDSSAGAGRYRGGLGVRYSFALRRGMARVTVLGERTKTPPPGIRGGWKGQGEQVIVQKANRIVRLPHGAKGEAILLQAGDAISIETPGGGGYGNPFTRSIHLVTRDVERAYLSREEAKRKYGVVYQEGSLDYDSVRTSRIRGYILAFSDEIYLEEIEGEE